MSHAEILAAVRLKAVEALGRFRLSDGEDPREAILLSNGIYCGKRFEVERGYAVWSAASDELSVYRSGKLLATIPQASAASITRRAAA